MLSLAPRQEPPRPRARRGARAALTLAFEWVAACAALSPALALAGCDVREDVNPLSSADVSACNPTPYTPMPADSCGGYVHLPCGLPPGVKPLSGPGCYFSISSCKSICHELYFTCHATDAHCTPDGTVVPGEDGSVDIDCVECLQGGGRGFEGFEAPSSSLGSTAEQFAALARLEAASVRAFAALALDLERLGAPAGLRSRVDRARRDEARHARLVGAAARRAGARVERVDSRPELGRSREALAVENAVEGCVGETFGALVLAWEQSRALTPEARELFAKLASDELEHALLAHDLDAWLSAGLDSEARARVERARRAAIERLERTSTDRALVVAAFRRTARASGPRARRLGSSRKSRLEPASNPPATDALSTESRS